MVYAGTAWVAGLVFSAMFGFAPVVLVSVFVTVLALKLLLKFDGRSILLMLVSFVIAFGHFHAYNAFVYRNIVGFEGADISYSGIVTDLRDYSDNNSVYFLDGKINGKNHAKIMIFTKSVLCAPGDKMTFNCRAEIPENSYIFKSRDYYRSKGIYLSSGYVENIQVKHMKYSLRKFLFDFRETISKAIGSALPKEESGILKGMLFGDKAGIAEDDMTMLYRTGIGHVTAVSGLHLVLFSMLISSVLRRFKMGVKTKFFLLEVFMILFSLCCGMSMSVLRAFIMMTLVNMAPLFFRYTDSLNSVCIAVILLTLPNPFVITNQSFVLSVSGAFGAGVFAPYMTKAMREDGHIRKFLKNAVYLLCVSAAVTPVSVICFGELSLISPLSNIIITPVCMVAIAISMTASILIIFKPIFLFKISGVICRIVLRFSRFIGENRFTHINLRGEYVSKMTVILILFCTVTFLAFKSKKYSIISVVMSYAVMFLISAAYNFQNNEILKIAMLGKNEVGVIIVSKGYAADVIDVSGRSDNADYAMKYLDSIGVTDINHVVVTKNPYAAMASYNCELNLCEVENFLLPFDARVREDMLICGCRPKYSEFSPWIVNYDKYSVSVSNERVAAEFDDFDFEFYNDANIDNKYIPNTVLNVSDSGVYNIRRLENG